jgi:hypothetical protein
MATDYPVTPAGTFDDPIWGETGGPFTKNESAIGPGLGSVPLTSNDYNYNVQHATRWIRAMRDRSYPTDQGLMASCSVSMGAWNVGGGTLDGTLTPSRMMIDGGSGGVLVEYFVPVGDPHTFAPETPTYVSLNGNGDVAYSTEETAGAGYVNVWLVTTNATEIVSAAVLIFTIPAFKTIGVQSLKALSLDVLGNAEIGGDLDVTGTVSMATEDGKTVFIGGDTEMSKSLAVNGNLEVFGNGSVRGPLFNATHASASAWRAAHRATLKTFAVGGVVAAGGGVVDTAITTSNVNLAALLFHINSLTTSNSANVGFDVDVVITWNSDGAATPPTGVSPGVRVRWTTLCRCNSATWADVINGTQEVLGVIGANVVAITISGGQLVLRVTHDLGVENRGYRMIATVSARVLQLA